MLIAVRRHTWSLLILLLLGLSGCSTVSSWTDTVTDVLWFDDDDDVDLSGYVEPKPGQKLPWKKVWSRSLDGEPDDHLIHPRKISYDEESAYVGTYEGHIARVALSDGDVLWRVDLRAPVSGGVTRFGEHIFAGTADGEVFALNRHNGSLVWRQRVSTKVASAPLVQDGLVIFTTLNNRTYALAIEDGERIWTHSSVPVALVVQGASTPTSNGREVFVGYSTGEVFALRLRDGQELWGDNLSRVSGRSELDRLQDVDAEVVIGPDGIGVRMPQVFSVNHQGYLMALHPTSGSRYWRSRFSAIRKPLLWRNRLFLSDVDGYVVSVGVSDGLEVWRTQVSNGTLTAPTLVNDQIVVADSRGRLVAMDATSGRVTAMNYLGDPVMADPVVADNKLLIWTNDGDLISYQIR